MARFPFGRCAQILYIHSTRNPNAIYRPRKKNVSRYRLEKKLVCCVHFYSLISLPGISLRVSKYHVGHLRYNFGLLLRQTNVPNFNFSHGELHQFYSTFPFAITVALRCVQLPLSSNLPYYVSPQAEFLNFQLIIT